MSYKKISIGEGKIQAEDIVIAGGFSNDAVEKFRTELWYGSFQQNKAQAMQSPNVGMLTGLFKKHDNLCLCIGYGPSLHEHINTLKCIYDRHRPFILSCDRAFGFLKSHGIKPDLTMTVDGKDIVADFFDEELIDKDDYFAAMLYTHPNVIKKLSKGRVFFGGMALNSPLVMKMRNEAGQRFFDVRASYVVGTALMYLAAHMGFSVVGSLGNDFHIRYKEALHGWEGNTKFIAGTPGDKPGELKRHVMIEAFFLAVNGASDIPGYFPDTSFIDCSGAPLSNWLAVSLHELYGLKFQSQNYGMKLLNRWSSFKN